MARRVDAVSEVLEVSLSEADATVLASVWQRCQKAWPGVELDEVTFFKGLAERMGPGSTIAERLHGLHSNDVYLALACGAQDAQALQHFERRIMGELRRALGRVDDTPGVADELCQDARQKFLVAEPGSRPTICAYRGEGPLLFWLRSIAIRDLFKQREREQRGREHESRLVDVVLTGDLELEIIRQQQRHAFAEAFESSFESLSARDRMVLRMHVIEKLTIDQICVVFQTHRTTAFRWLEAAKAQLSKTLKQTLALRLHLGPRDLDSLLGKVRSPLELSLRRILSRTAQ